MASVSVPLYTQHLNDAGQVRTMIAGLKAVMDQEQTRQALINLNSVSVNIDTYVYPTNLVGRIEALSSAIADLEMTLSQVEAGIRGSIRYPKEL